MSTRPRASRALAAALTAVVALAAFAVAPAAAITNGTQDTTHHDVGLMTAHDSDGHYLWRCSGTLLNANVFVTAGHCTESPAAYAVVFFSDTTIIPDPDFTLTTRSCTGIAGYPCGGPNSFRGSIHTHPQFDTNAFFLHDLGVVVLDGAGFVPAGGFGALPKLNSLDGLHPGRSTTFTAVGFGLQAAFPDAAAWKDVAVRQRMVAHPWLDQINTPFVGDASLLLSNNASGGGTCFGDSGGPNFVGSSNILAGVTSFGLNPTCAGTGGVYRIDKSDDIAFLATFGVAP